MPFFCKIDRELSRIGADLDMKVNVLTKATAAHKAQAPQLRQKFGTFTIYS